MNSSSIKLCLVGDTNVGKTSLVNRYLFNNFTKSSATIAANFSSKIITSGNRSCKLQIWDTAGQERFRAMAPLYYRNAQIAIVVVSTDFEQAKFASSVKFWIDQLGKTVANDVVISVCVNKSDLSEDDWMITRHDLSKLVSECNTLGCDVYVTSAKENKGVSAMFQASIAKCLEKIPNQERESSAAPRSERKELLATLATESTLEGEDVNENRRYKKANKASCC
jgi:Ras-related protein Rab-21